MRTEEEILRALSKVIHPEKGKDIVTIGMVQYAYEDENGISVVLEPERPNDPFLASIKSTIVKALKSAFGPDTSIASIEVNRGAEELVQEEKPDNIVPGVKNVIAIASGKGGVGKTTVAVNLAIALAKAGNRVGLVDADIFGPSVPKMLGAVDFKPEIRMVNGAEKIAPLEKFGIKVLSAGFFVNPKDATIWRGPMASNFLKQIIELGDWGELDYLLFDLPPGTSDIHLTLVQEVAVTGAIIVTTPQEVALADAIKGISMFRSDKIEVPIIGLIENMSYFTPAELPENKYYIFGKEGGQRLANEMNVGFLGQIPIVQSICESGDKGTPPALEDSIVGNAFAKLAGEVVAGVAVRNKLKKPTTRVQVTK